MNALVKHHRRSFAALLFFLCLHATSWGQLKANFTATSTAGCSPLLVYFSDSSTGNPSGWKWDLGNGVTSLLRNPSATYFNPGTYNVKLIVSNAAGSDSIVKSQYVTVYANPNVVFDFDKASGCFPLKVNFKDKSTPGSGTISSWQWDFGDGTISNQQNPSHTYTSAGAFHVTLRVTNSFGCIKSYTQIQAISIADGVKASFTNTDPGICPAPAAAQFTNTSIGPGPLTFQWNFGDGTGSPANSPSHTYNSNGTYSVSLIATSPQGCVDTFTKQDVFKIGSAKASFNYPANACVNEPVQFTNTSSPAPVSVKWDFGNGTSSAVLSPLKTYAQAGLYTVSLISNFNGCSDTVKKLLTVSEKPVPDFTTVQQASCKLPVNVQFKSLATGDQFQYRWDFGDGATATGAMPSHAYSSEGLYTVKLIVTNAGGCTDSIIKKNFVRIQVPRVSVAGLPKNGCSPITVTPTATITAGQTITSYQWDFGDGSTATDAAPSHTYSQAGNYDVTLITTNSLGCTDTITLMRTVRVGNKPHADYVYSPKVTCPYEKVFFTDKSTGGVDQWFWDFGDGGTSTQASPFHQFGDTGWHDVRLVVFNNTCPDTLIVKNAVYVNPPISIFEVKHDCNDKFTKTFVDKSLGPQSWFWEFGDGITSTEQNPVHTYATTGTYKVRLTVTNGSCTHFSEKTVLVIDEKAEFLSSDSILCRNNSVVFTPTGIGNTNIASWNWDFGDGTSSKDSTVTTHTYTVAGIYTAGLTITDLLGCKSTKSTQVKVFGPTASFKPSVAASCLKENLVSFTDASTHDGQHPIVKWIWNYGDSVVDSAATLPYQHSYTKAGSYTISLTVVDDYGCRDSNVQKAAVVIAQPVADFKPSDTLTCTNRAVAFTNLSTGISPTYQWSFGDGTSATTVSPSHAYWTVGTYSIKLLLTDKYGCKDSVIKNNLVKISYPKAQFSLSDSVGTCPPLLVHFTNESKDYSRIYWDFGDGNNSTLDTPAHFYSTPGTFYATLIATGPGGCTDTMRRKIVVKGPTGTFRYTPLTGCKPLTVNFTATTRNNASFIWDFSDGSTVGSKDTAVSHTYISSGDFVPKMILTDAGGCSVPVVGTDTIRVKGVTTDLKLDAATFCNDGVVQFSNQTVSNDIITGYHWDFGDSETSTDANPKHHYAASGVYSVQLLVTTQSGCFDKKTLSDTVKVYANPIVQITGDSAACAPANFTFNGQVKRGNVNLLKWNWDLANGNTSAQQNPALQTYLVDGSYTIKTIVTDEHGCRDTASKAVTVYPIPQTNAGADQWICRGSFLQLKATGANKYSWQPAASLSCTDCDSPLAAPTDSTQYVVTGYNSFGCSKTDSVILRVHQPFTLTVGKGDTICAGNTIRLIANGADQYTWTPALDVKNPSGGNTTATPQTSTLYTVVAKDNFNCFTDTGSVFIKVWPIPTIALESAQTLTVGSTLQLTPKYSADATSYQWSNAQTLSCATCPSPVAKPKTETKYTISVKNDGGCTAQADVTVHVICNDGNLFIPNTFSPNTDGRNDRFYPRGTGISSIKSLKVFNRWGELVFSRESFNANDAAAGWDGSYKGQPLAPDVYVYTCEVICMNNEVLTFTGDVTLLR
jgi:gliding motility-associated-like protein